MSPYNNFSRVAAKPLETIGVMKTNVMNTRFRSDLAKV